MLWISKQILNFNKNNILVFFNLNLLTVRICIKLFHQYFHVNVSHKLFPFTDYARSWMWKKQLFFIFRLIYSI